MLKAVLVKVKEVPEGKGLGGFYWEPQGAASWSGYKLSAWGDDGRPTSALDAFI
jgi:arabinogalactan endo-1,4-beta-galactosidase